MPFCAFVDVLVVCFCLFICLFFSKKVDCPEPQLTLRVTPVHAARTAFFGLVGFPFYVRGRCTGKPVTSMLNIFSRHPLVDADEHSFVNSCCDEALASKGVLAATVWVNGNESHKVNLYTTHFLVRCLASVFVHLTIAK